MSKIGLASISAILLFGLIIPLVAYKLSRRIGLKALLTFALAVGLGYGAAKSEYSWTSHAVLGNFALMLASAIAVVGYIGLSVGAARLIAGPFARMRP